MYDETKLNELRKKANELRKEKRDLTVGIDQKISDVLSDLYAEERSKEEWKRMQKERSKPSYMNLIFKWDNGIKFDTRNKKGMIHFKDFVFNYGLPTSFEVRG